MHAQHGLSIPGVPGILVSLNNLLGPHVKQDHSKETSSVPGDWKGKDNTGVGVGQNALQAASRTLVNVFVIKHYWKEGGLHSQASQCRNSIVSSCRESGLLSCIMALKLILT